MNAELRRNLWLQFSIPRLIIAPAAIGIVLVVVFLYSGHSPAAVCALAEWIYLLVVLFWGTRRAADLVAEEIAGGTWDSQRMSALGAWQMTWGKFTGGISYVWYVAGIAFLSFVWARAMDGALPLHRDEAAHDLQLLGTGCLGQAVSFVTSLVLLRKQVTRRRLGVTLSQFAGIAAAAVASGHLDLSLLFRRMPVIDWFGWQFPGFEFALVTLGLFLAWSLFAAYRLMRIELQFRTIPWAWVAFALFVMAYAEGLLFVAINRAPNWLGAWLTGPFVLAILLSYAALFLEPKDVVRYRGLWAALSAARWGRAMTLLPQWVPIFLIAAALGLVLTLFGGLSELPGVPHLIGLGLSFAGFNALPSLGLLPVELALYLLRDILIVLFFNFGPRRGWVDLTVFICLLLAYFPVLWIMNFTGGTLLIPIVVPSPMASPLLSLGVPVAECLILATMVLRRASA
jgi:hypothetical protein